MRVGLTLSVKLKQALIVLPAILSVKGAQASDFSQAQATYVPPSLITRYASASLNPGSAYIDSTLGLISPDSSASSTPASDIMSALSQASTLPGLSNIKASVQNFLQQGDLGQAEALASKYYKAIPPSVLTQVANAATAAAQKYLQNHDLGAAGDQIRQALAIDPNNRTSRSVYGQILSASGLNANSAGDHVKLGDNLIAQGKYREAAIEYNNALAIKPSAEAHVGLGNIAYTLGRTDLASNEYEKALSVNPQSELALRQRGLLKYAMQDQIGANTDLSKALTLSSRDRIAGEALLELWRRQLAANANDPNGHLGLARAYLLTGDLDSARTEYQEVARLDPNNPHLPAARNSFRLALSKREANNCFEAAKTLNHEGALKDAHKKMLEAISLSPRDVNMLLFDAKLSEKLGSYDDARQTYLNILKEDPKNITAAARLKKMPGKISENVSAQIENSQSRDSAKVDSVSKTDSVVKTGDIAPATPLRDLLTPEIPKLAPSNSSQQQDLPLKPQINIQSATPLNSQIDTASEYVPMDNLTNFICLVRELAINNQLEMKEVDRLNKESLKAAQAELARFRSPLTNNNGNLASVSTAPPPVTFLDREIDPTLGF